MQITANAWNEYITRLSRLNQKAGQLMREYKSYTTTCAMTKGRFRSTL